MKVRIYKPAKTAMQSARGKAKLWVVEPELTSKRQPESLMGWTASGDTLNQLRLKFPTRDAAVEYAEAQGWEYVVARPHERRVKPRNYGDNFKYYPAETV